ncbi:MAG: dTDP-4-dehydrorhamnose 3,5-epimerase family protein [Myxococcota bacterium]
MNFKPMTLAGGYLIDPKIFHDDRGEFYEVLRPARLEEATGYRFTAQQFSFSRSHRNILRGIHTTRVPPGQAKVVSCAHGSILTATVDLRVGSPTFGQFELTPQDAESGVSVVLTDGLGHAFLVLSDTAVVSYLASKEYQPGTMIEIDALDPALGIEWPLQGEPIRSPKDAAAPTADEAAASGILPTYEQCLRSAVIPEKSS